MSETTERKIPMINMTPPDAPESANGPSGRWEIHSGRMWRDGDGVHSAANVSWGLFSRRDKDKTAPGARLIGTAGWLLALLAAGLLFVSFSGQYTYIFAARHQHTAAMIEALMFDVGMIIFSLLALGLARAGKPARTQRVLIMACSAGSAAMNYAAADTASPRSVLAYTAAPVFLAVVVDQVVAVIRKHVRVDDEASPWAVLGRATLRAAWLAGRVLAYSLRTILAFPETTRGLRQMVLNAAPLPDLPPVMQPEAIEPPASKKAAFIRAYRAHPDYGDRSKASQVAKELAPAAGLQWGTARSYALADLDGRAS
jgi:hypothetical protein